MKSTHVFAAITITAGVVLAGCSSSSPDDGIPQDVQDWASTAAQAAADSAQSYQPTTPAPKQKMVDAELGVPVVIGDGIVTVTINSLDVADSCTTDSGTSYDGDYLIVDYSLEAGNVPTMGGLKWVTLDDDGYSQDTGMGMCSESSPSLDQFDSLDKVRGTHVFSIEPGAAVLEAQPRFGNAVNATLPAGWGWQIPQP